MNNAELQKGYARAGVVEYNMKAIIENLYMIQEPNICLAWGNLYMPS